MLPVVIMISAIIWFSNKNRGSVFSKRNLALAGIFILINWLVISGGHLFYDMFFPLDKYEYHSGILRRTDRNDGEFCPLHIYTPAFILYHGVWIW